MRLFSPFLQSLQLSTLHAYNGTHRVCLGKSRRSTPLVQDALSEAEKHQKRRRGCVHYIPCSRRVLRAAQTLTLAHPKPKRRRFDVLVSGMSRPTLDGRPVPPYSVHPGQFPSQHSVPLQLACPRSSFPSHYPHQRSPWPCYGLTVCTSPRSACHYSPAVDVHLLHGSV